MIDVKSLWELHNKKKIRGLTFWWIPRILLWSQTTRTPVPVSGRQCPAAIRLVPHFPLILCCAVVRAQLCLSSVCIWRLQLSVPETEATLGARIFIEIIKPQTAISTGPGLIRLAFILQGEGSWIHTGAKGRPCSLRNHPDLQYTAVRATRK